MKLSMRGRFTRAGKGKASAIARCDSSGVMGMYSMMVKQYIRAGKDIVWSGQWVLPKFKDIPNASFIPTFKVDPIPLKHVRPDPDIGAQTTIATSRGAISLDISGNQDITLTAEQFNNGSITFFGILTGNIVIYIPSVYNQVYMNNITTGGFSIGMQLIDNPFPAINLPQADPLTGYGPVVSYTLYQLQIVYT